MSSIQTAAPQFQGDRQAAQDGDRSSRLATKSLAAKRVADAYRSSHDAFRRQSGRRVLTKKLAVEDGRLAEESGSGQPPTNSSVKQQHGGDRREAPLEWEQETQANCI